jgi:hypothetical protein
VAAVLVILPGGVAQQQIALVPLIVGGVVASGGWLAYIWHRLNPDSMNALLTFNSLSMLLVTIGLMIGMWEARLWGRLEWLFTAYLHVYLAIFIAVVGASLYWVLRAPYLRQAYGILQTYLPAGVITDYQLWRFLWPHDARYSQFSQRLGAASSVAAMTGLLLAGFSDRGAVFYVCFLLFLLIAAFMMAMALAHLWAHQRYLRGQDLRIVWTQ